MSVESPRKSNPTSWTALYVMLVAASLVVCAVFFQVIGPIHVAAVAVLGVAAPLGLALLAGRFTHPPESPASEKRTALDARGSSAWFAAGLFVVASAKFTALGFLSSGFTPALHDEWSYLFGARTLAAGRLSNPTPPHPEFFDAFHVLTEPRWVTRYPPGHPAALALGALIGWPPLVVIGLTAGTIVWIYLLGREVGGESTGKLAGVVAVLAPGLDGVATSYLSQSTFLFAITGCYAAALRAVRGPSPVWSAVAGVLGGWAILTRPYSATALGLPLAVWFVWRGYSVRSTQFVQYARASDRSSFFKSPWIRLVGASLPLVASLCLWAAYNHATTGDAWRMAWTEYNRQYEPDNTLGFSSGPPRQIPAGLYARKAAKAQSIADEKAAFTWRAALRRALADPSRAAQTVFPAVGFYGLAAFVPFGLRASRSSAERLRASCWLLVGGIAAHYVAYSFFYSQWKMYGVEPLPLVVVLVAAGLAEFWRRGRDSDRPTIALAVPLVMLAGLALECRELPTLAGQRRDDTDYHRRFAETLDRLGDTRAIVFVRLHPPRQHPYDLINNSPDLSGRVLVVLDFGARNAELLRTFPGRHGYFFDEANWSLTRWTPPPTDAPSRSKAPRSP